MARRRLREESDGLVDGAIPVRWEVRSRRVAHPRSRVAARAEVAHEGGAAEWVAPPVGAVRRAMGVGASRDAVERQRALSVLLGSGVNGGGGGGGKHACVSEWQVAAERLLRGGRVSGRWAGV